MLLNKCECRVSIVELEGVGTILEAWKLAWYCHKERAMWLTRKGDEWSLRRSVRNARRSLFLYIVATGSLHWKM